MAAFQLRLGHVCVPVPAQFIDRAVQQLENTNSENEDASHNNPSSLHASLLCHIGACLDVNECDLSFMSAAERGSYVAKLARVAGLWAAQLDECNRYTAHEYSRHFIVVHTNMLSRLNALGRRAPETTLQTWKTMTSAALLENVAFIMLAQLVRGVLSVQASSAASERLFSKTGLLETGNRHCMLPDTMEKLLVIKSYVQEGITVPLSQHRRTVSSDVALAFAGLVDNVATKIEENTNN